MSPTPGARPEHWTEGDIEVGGVRLHFHRTGRGDAPPLVLAHGLSDNGLCWTRVAQALEPAFDIVMLDARNHGQSSRGPVKPVLLADDVFAAITELGLAQPAMIGHSVGAHTAALLASRTTGIVSRLVLEDPPWTADGAAAPTEHHEAADERQQQIRAWIESFQGMSDDDLTELGHTQHSDWPEEEFPAWIASNRQVRSEAADGLSAGGWADIVDGISCPTLLLRGDAGRGGIVTEATAERIAASNGNVTARLIDAAGHNIRRENFEHFIAEVGEFLRHR